MNALVPTAKPPLDSQDREFMNSLSGFVDTLFSASVNVTGSAQLSQSDTMYGNLRWYPLSNNRQLLSQLYFEHGIVQTLIDQPVDDAYRAGFTLKTDQISPEELEELELFIEESQAVAQHAEATKWARLFGGGGVIIITDQDYETPLDEDSITPDTPLAFRAVDMWELFEDAMPTLGDLRLETADEYYTYYGKKIHKSRVIRVEGKKAPSFIRPRLRGWGCSEVEKLVRSLNQYFKNQDVVFELLDEAKIDVYKIKGFASSLAQKGGTQALTTRVQAANTVKNYLNALTMDAEDDYAQKQIQFTGLSDMLLQIRQGIAADLKMPMSKIFGISAAGFNSGEDDIENYNSMLESEIRAKNKFQILRLVKICARKKFGYSPDDIKMTWNPLRVLSAEQEENVKEKKFNRVVGAFDRGLADPKEAKEAINKDSLLGIELKESDEVFDLGEGDDGGDENNNPKKDNKE